MAVEVLNVEKYLVVDPNGAPDGSMPEGVAGRLFRIATTLEIATQVAATRPGSVIYAKQSVILPDSTQSVIRFVPL